MEILGTNFSITLGSWRLCFRIAIEDVDAPMPPKARVPHKMRVVSEEYYRASSAN